MLRQGTLNGTPMRIGGLGRIKTHPAHRRRGFGNLGIRRAVGFLHTSGAAFGLLVCEPPLIDYYGRDGWREFTGTLLVLQRGGSSEFTFNRVMTVGIQTTAPTYLHHQPPSTLSRHNQAAPRLARLPG